MAILFLDDMVERTKTFLKRYPAAITVDNAQSCIDQLSRTDITWDRIWLDHDLGGETFVDASKKNTGSEVVRWISANKPKSIVDNCLIIVHSLNAPEAVRMVANLQESGYDAIYIPFTQFKQLPFDP